jgi:hypothetical protein
LWTDALDPYRVAGFVAIRADVEYDDGALDAVVASVEPRRQSLAVQTKNG